MPFLALRENFLDRHFASVSDEILDKPKVKPAPRRVAQETGTEYIPLGDLIGDKLKDQMFDGIHPNRVGHRLIAEEIARVVASALAANAPDSTTR